MIPSDNRTASVVPEEPGIQRVALIGPVWPYRGGIAQYTGQLKRALEKVCLVQMISFKRQYPKWLYPGKSDKEPGHSNEREEGVSYSLDAFSPISWRRTTDEIAAHGCDHAILNWWTLFWAPAFAYMAWRLRRKGIRTSFLCHNLFDHDAKGFKTRLSKLLLGAADGYIVHSSEQAALLKQLHPCKPILKRLHPIYRHFPTATTELHPRGRLELLFFGFIRPYKGLEILLQALSELNDVQIHLTIVGEAWANQEPLLDSARKSGVNIESHLRYVDELEAASFFQRADVVVLPYLAATGSGVATLAYHYGKPIIASRVGGLQEAVIEGTTGWLVAPGSVVDLKERIAKTNRVSAKALSHGINMFVDQNGWDAMASAIRDFHP